MKDIAQIAREITSANAAWMETHLAELLAAGVLQSEIEVQIHPNMRTVIVVRGVPAFEWIVKLDTGDVPTED